MTLKAKYKKWWVINTTDQGDREFQKKEYVLRPWDAKDKASFKNWEKPHVAMVERESQSPTWYISWGRTEIALPGIYR